MIPIVGDVVRLTERAVAWDADLGNLYLPKGSLLEIVAVVSSRANGGMRQTYDLRPFPRDPEDSTWTSLRCDMFEEITAMEVIAIAAKD